MSVNRWRVWLTSNVRGSAKYVTVEAASRDTAMLKAEAAHQKGGWYAVDATPVTVKLI
jgi:hypothetical protein